jgi:hypothetical protein
LRTLRVLRRVPLYVKGAHTPSPTDQLGATVGPPYNPQVIEVRRNGEVAGGQVASWAAGGRVLCSIKEQEQTAMHRNVLRLLATMLVTLGLFTVGVTPAVAQEERTVQVTIDQATVDPRTGEVTLTGTAACSGAGSAFVFAEIYGQLRQDVEGAFTVWGFFYELVALCPPEGAAFSVTSAPPRAGSGRDGLVSLPISLAVSPSIRSAPVRSPSLSGWTPLSVSPRPADASPLTTAG